LAGRIEVEPAEDCARQALALAEALGMRPLLGHCQLGLGALYTMIGRREPAQAELTTARALFRALEITFWLPEAEATLAQMEGENGLFGNGVRASNTAALVSKMKGILLANSEAPTCRLTHDPSEGPEA
jgi:hypothetical protein